MNKFIQKLALALIDRRLRKMVKKASKQLARADYKEQRTTTLHNVLEDHQEYTRLRHLRENIANINNPWQGIFSPYWTVWPKNKKLVQRFKPLIRVPFELPPLSPEDQEWADLSLVEFYERLYAEPYSVVEVRRPIELTSEQEDLARRFGWRNEVKQGVGLLREKDGEPYNPVHLYRQFKARTNAIEYTMYFHKDGTKYRLDHEIPLEKINAMENPEVEVKNILWGKIDRGEYKEINN